MNDDDWLSGPEESEEQLAARMKAIRDEARNAEKPPKVYPTDLDEPPAHHGYRIMVGGHAYHADPEFDARTEYYSRMLRSRILTKEELFGRMYGRSAPMIIMDEIDYTTIEDRIMSTLADKAKAFIDAVMAVPDRVSMTDLQRYCEADVMMVKPTAESRRYFAFDKPEGTRAERRAAMSKRSHLYEKPDNTSPKRSLLRGGKPVRRQG